MTRQLQQLELLAEIDTLVERLRRWADEAPDWQPAETCRALVRQLIGRTDKLRMRLEAPLVVATLGGSGTGKSALVNALVGEAVVTTGRQRPTTVRPTMLCRPGITPELLGIDAAAVEVIALDRPFLGELVLIDCPDPDTTEEYDEETESHRHAPRREALGVETVGAEAGAGRPVTTNLEQLRAILPHCDVLLVTTTQQKYRSAVVAEELAAAAPGARLVLVQTHADSDDDIRNDWRSHLGAEFADDRVYRVDSLASLAAVVRGQAVDSDFADLVELLTRRLAGVAQARIRRANFLELAAETLQRCRARLDAAMPAIAEVERALEGQRAKLLAQLTAETRDELLASKRQWEQRLVDRAASRWGFSPFALVLRAYQGLGGLVSGVWLARARSPAQLALWGAVTGTRSWQSRRKRHEADPAADRALASCWDDAELRAASLVLEGYATEAGLARHTVDVATVGREAADAGAGFVGRAGAQIDALIDQLAARHTGWFTRRVYEFLFLAMLVALLFRLGKNFFYDSWLAQPPVPVHGIEAYLASLFWLLLWCFVLLWALVGRLRRGLRRRLDELTLEWASAPGVTGLFAGLEAVCRDVRGYRTQLEWLDGEVHRLRDEALPAAR